MTKQDVIGLLRSSRAVSPCAHARPGRPGGRIARSAGGPVRNPGIGYVVNQWANGYGQNYTFGNNPPQLASCVVPLTTAYSVGGGSGTPDHGELAVRHRLLDAGLPARERPRRGQRRHPLLVAGIPRVRAG